METCIIVNVWIGTKASCFASPRFAGILFLLSPSLDFAYSPKRVFKAACI